MLTGEYRLYPAPVDRSGPPLCAGMCPAEDKLDCRMGQMELGRGQGAARQPTDRFTLFKVSLKD